MERRPNDFLDIWAGLRSASPQRIARLNTREQFAVCRFAISSAPRRSMARMA